VFDHGNWLSISNATIAPNGGTFDDEDEALFLEEPFFLLPPRMVFMPCLGLVV
jgi:hypothetical protein